MSATTSAKVSGGLYEWTGDAWTEWAGSDDRARESSWPFAPEISVLTWNVWAEQTYAVERANAIIADIARLCPDIVGLQEVTRDEYGEPCFWDVFHQNAFVRSEYFISTLEEQNDLVFDSDEAPHNSIMMVRKAFAARVAHVSLWYHHLTTGDNRSSLMAIDLYDASGLRLTVATVRLEDDQSQEGRATQEVQFIETLSALSGGSIIVTGDLGVRTETDLQPFLASSYVDIWRLCHPSIAPAYSYTYGPFGFAEHSDPGRPLDYRRTDFVLARGDWYTGGNTQLVGHIPLREGPTQGSFVNEHGQPVFVYPSSHLGVSATFTLERETMERSAKRSRRQ